MLGITIGIAAVICTVAIGQGGTQMVQDQLVGLGTNLVWVEAGGANLNGVRTGNGETKTLSVDDALAIARSVSTIAYISPNVDGPVQVVYGHNNWGTNFRGVSPEYLDIRHRYFHKACLSRKMTWPARPMCACSARPWPTLSSATRIRLARSFGYRTSPFRCSA